ncbi:hypothetical protein Poly59_05610 [Rubripirellula reticaptiva]|uniref:Uncharacterized protein n=1 Tax=Rubripirellula reticaptiva TaxID=2528013 RepID=A0A5C6FBK4_9BACT|nr:hypothetical protein Poly59_05610 [Rubripirellula reticaptiva]
MMCCPENRGMSRRDTIFVIRKIRPFSKSSFSTVDHEPDSLVRVVIRGGYVVSVADEREAIDVGNPNTQRSWPRREQSLQSSVRWAEWVSVNS